MKANDEIDLGNGHIVQIGSSTWNDQHRSVRNRYPTATGGFNVRASGELPIVDILPVVQIVARNDEFSISQCVTIIEFLSASIRRQSEQ